MATDSETDEGGWIPLNERSVDSSGRVSLPIDTFGLGVGDVVNLIVITDDEEHFYAPDLPILEGGRVSIPDHQRRLYGIESGDEVSCELQPTGATVG